MMDRNVMRKRTRDFAVRVIRLVAALPAGRVGDVLGRQILKSGTSIGANYREAIRTSSRRHFVTTLEIAQRESDETLYWLDLIAESGLVKAGRLKKPQQACDELLSIVAATVKSTKQRRVGAKSEIRNPKSEIAQ
ncbi:MAG: four helix bundle protein [Phycisphaeraceae bacterium]